MQIEYFNAPLPGEHNNGEIWVHWRLDIGDSTIKGCSQTKEKAETAVRKQIDSYMNRNRTKKTKTDTAALHRSVVGTRRSA